MVIFSQGYTYIRNNYFLPLTQHRITYRNLSTNSIKQALCSSKCTSVSVLNNNSGYSFRFDNDTIFNSLLSDMWMCYIRSLIQCESTKKMYSIGSSLCPNWSIVSDYYTAFYDASTFLRLSMRGNIFFDKDSSKSISEIITALTHSPNPLGVSSNSLYSIHKDNVNACDAYELTLIPSGKQTHETVWIEVGKLLREMKRHSNPGSDEETVLKCIIQVLTTLGDTFPSQLRNAVNYQLPYGLKSVEKKILPSATYVERDRWLDPILSFDAKTKLTDIDKVAIFRAYTYYIHLLTHNLIAEYYQITGRECGIEAAVNKNRESKIKSPVPIFTYK